MKPLSNNKSKTASGPGSKTPKQNQVPPGLQTFQADARFTDDQYYDKLTASDAEDETVNNLIDLIGDDYGISDSSHDDPW